MPGASTRGSTASGGRSADDLARVQQEALHASALKMPDAFPKYVINLAAPVVFAFRVWWQFW